MYVLSDFFNFATIEDKFTCTQINLHHCRSASANLMQRLSKRMQTFLCFIQEPWVNKGRIIGLSGFPRQLFAPPECGNPRACILASADAKLWIMPQFCDRDMVAVMTEESSGTGLAQQKRGMVFASAYLPGDSPTDPPSDLLVRLVDFCEYNKLPLVVAADANAHHTVWGSSDCNRRGKALLDYIGSTSLCVCNVGTEPSFVVQNRKEVIDITLSSFDCAHRISRWNVSSDISFSDHKYIEFDFMFNDSEPQALSRNVRNTDWDVFAQHTDSRLEQCKEESMPTSPADVEILASYVNLSFQEAMKKACPLKRKKKRKTVPYWSRELTELRREARRLQRIARRAGNDPITWENYVNARRAFQRALKRAKRESWRSFCQEVEGCAPTARIYRLLKNEVHPLGLLKGPNGEYTKNPSETIELLLRTHFPSKPDTEAELDSDVGIAHEPMSIDLVKQIVSERFIREAVSSFKPYKAPGMDGVYPIHLQKGGQNLLVALCLLFQGCLCTGYVPELWRQVRVVFLPKPGKEDYRVPKSFRPVSLMSFLLKTLERLVLWRIQSVTLRFRPLSPRQHAYQAGKSTETALHNLVAKIEREIGAGNYALAVFLDFQGAFDFLPTRSMVRAMRRFDVEPVLSRWVEFMLRNRTAYASIKGASAERRVERGTPQGGVDSPLLWNLAINTLLEKFEDKTVFCHAFADDVALLQVGLDPSMLEHQMNWALRVVGEWAEENSLQFSPGKSQAIMFTRRRKWSLRPLRLQGEEIQVVKETRYLGVILDQRLSWRPHCEYRANKARGALAVCRRMIGKTWGLKPGAMKWLYTAVIRPALAYACLVWVPVINTRSIFEPMVRVQRQACLAISSAYKGTPQAALEVLLDIPPLDLFLHSQACLAAWRLKCCGQWLDKNALLRRFKGHMYVCMKGWDEYSVLSMPSDLIFPVWSNIYDRKVIFQEFPLEEPRQGTYIACYTASRKVSRKVGAGFYIEGYAGETDQESFSFGTLCMNFQAELEAIREAGLLFLSAETTNQRLSFYIESVNVFKALASLRVDKKLVDSCRKVLEDLGDLFVEVRVCLASRLDNSGYSKAVMMARKGGMMTPMGPEPFVPVSKHLSRLKMQEAIRSTHSSRWQRASREAYRQSRESGVHVCRKISETLCRLSRSMLKQVIQVLTGHGNFRRHRFLQKLSESALCAECGLAEETAEHFICLCPSYDEKRKEVFGDGPLLYNALYSLENLDKLVSFLSGTDHLRRAHLN